MIEIDAQSFLNISGCIDLSNSTLVVKMNVSQIGQIIDIARYSCLTSSFSTVRAEIEGVH